MNTGMDTMHDERLLRAKCALDGLSVGDAFGQGYFVRTGSAEQIVADRAVAPAPWLFTDDTLMALSVFSVLRQRGTIDQDLLAASFGQRYDFYRAYGASMHSLLAQYREGHPWQACAPALFEGQGSFGNGAAMRVAPVGGYFADNITEAARQAALQAEVTHSHEEAIAGAIAVAVAAAIAWQWASGGIAPEHAAFLDAVAAHVPHSEVRSRINRAREMGPDAGLDFAVAVLGNGVGVSAQDTVPFALWCAAAHLGDYAEALWRTVSGLGDRDTTCAIAGGVVAMYVGADGIPAEWLAAREDLPDWPFTEVAA